TLQKIRTGGNQTVTVQHANVESGARPLSATCRPGVLDAGGTLPKRGNAVRCRLRGGAVLMLGRRDSRARLLPIAASRAAECMAAGWPQPIHGRYRKATIEARPDGRAGLRAAPG